MTRVPEVMRRSWLLLTLLATGCDWISLARNSATYETLCAGEAGNVVVAGGRAFTTLGEGGVLVRSSTGDTTTVALPAGIESADDLAVADGMLFVLDARPPGHVAALAVDSAELRWRGPIFAVPVGPFSGISARDGMVMISGGTSLLTLWRYDRAGLRGDMLSSIDLGRGQPDVLLGAGGIAYVSTHYWGPYFGIDVIRWNRQRDTLDVIAKVALDGAGFTTGGAKPANFPIALALANDTTLLVAYARGIAVLDVREPSRPRVSNVIDVAGAAVSIDVAGDTAVVSVAGSPAGLRLVAWRTGSIAAVVTLPAGTNPAGVAFTQRDVILAARDRGILTWSRPTLTMETSR